MPSIVFANENTQQFSETKIMSLENDSEIYDYANSIYQKHLHALTKSGALPGNLEDYYLGQPFTIFNVTNNTNSTCFPAIKQNSMSAILEINNSTIPIIQ